MNEQEFTKYLEAATAALETATETIRKQQKLIEDQAATIERQKKELENEYISRKQSAEIIKELRNKLQTGLGGRYSRST
jgi:multidrug resistance efflux pump